MNGDERLTQLLAHHFDERLTVEEANELNERLLESESARDDFWRQAQIHSRLRQWGEQESGKVRDAPAPTATAASPTSRPKYWSLAAAALAAGLLLAAGWSWLRSPVDPAGPIARFATLKDARWVAAGEDHQPGDALAAGQRIELSAGRASIEFLSGATVELIGPAIFAVETRNSGYLTLG